MKRLLLVIFLIVLAMSQAESASLQRGKTFGATETVTNSKLHQLIDNGNVTNIEQTDIKANYGLTEKSSTQPSDTDSLWNDTSSGTVKAYISGSWIEVSGNVVGDLAVAGDITGSGDIYSVDDMFVGDDLRVSGDTTVTGGIWTGGSQVGQQEIKGWINFVGTGTASINGSYNVASLTDNGTGDYTITWDTDFANDDYAVTMIIGGATLFGVIDSANGLTTGTARMQALDVGGSPGDPPLVTVIAIGDQ